MKLDSTAFPLVHEVIHSKESVMAKSQAASTATLAAASPATDALPDIESLRLTQDFAANVGVKKALITIPVRKPNAQDFVRVHPDPGYRLETMVLELKEDRETYLVAPDLWSDLSGELSRRVLFTCINRQRVISLWPVRLPGEDGRIDAWSASAMEAAAMAQTRWVRVQSNMALGAYEVFEASATIPDPDWPGESFKELVRIAFKDRYITAIDHTIVKRLRGLA